MKREFVINRHGKDYVLYAGLLDEAHQQGLKAIRTHLVQPPLADNGNVAICMAEVITDRGTFTGLGDASPDNVSRAMANALIRLAETRAKARALRDAINVSMVSVEELTDIAPESLAVDSVDEAPRLAPVTPLSLHVSAPRSTSGSYSPPSPPASIPVTNHEPANGAAGTHTGRGPGTTTGGVPAGIPTGHTLPPGVVPLPTRPTASATNRLPVESAPDAPRTRRIREASSAGGPSGPGGPGRSGASGGAPGGKVPIDGAPATPTQVETIAKLARSIGRTVPTDDLTRAAASELITRLSEERYGTRRGG